MLFSVCSAWVEDVLIEAGGMVIILEQSEWQSQGVNCLVGLRAGVLGSVALSVGIRVSYVNSFLVMMY